MGNPKSMDEDRRCRLRIVLVFSVGWYLFVLPFVASSTFVFSIWYAESNASFREGVKAALVGGFFGTYFLIGYSVVCATTFLLLHLAVHDLPYFKGRRVVSLLNCGFVILSSLPLFWLDRMLRSHVGLVLSLSLVLGVITAGTFDWVRGWYCGK